MLLNAINFRLTDIVAYSTSEKLGTFDNSVCQNAVNQSKQNKRDKLGENRQIRQAKDRSTTPEHPIRMQEREAPYASGNLKRSRLKKIEEIAPIAVFVPSTNNKESRRGPFQNSNGMPNFERKTAH